MCNCVMCNVEPTVTDQRKVVSRPVGDLNYSITIYIRFLQAQSAVFFLLTRNSLCQEENQKNVEYRIWTAQLAVPEGRSSFDQREKKQLVVQRAIIELFNVEFI